MGSIRSSELEPRITPTLAASWGNYAGYEVIHYYKSRSGLVYLGGTATRLNATTSVIFTLPSGYRPRSGLCFFNYNTGTTIQSIEISGAGTVTFVGGNSDFVPLDGIWFRV